MLKFWRFGARAKISRLEAEFVNRGNTSQDDLVKGYFQRVFLASETDELYDQRQTYRNLIKEAKELDLLYRSYFTGRKESHPNYEKLQLILHSLYNLIDNEINHRRGYSVAA
jgi:hypothetical protein